MEVEHRSTVKQEMQNEIVALTNRYNLPLDSTVSVLMSTTIMLARKEKSAHEVGQFLRRAASLEEQRDLARRMQ